MQDSQLFKYATCRQNFFFHGVKRVTMIFTSSQITTFLLNKENCFTLNRASVQIVAKSQYREWTVGPLSSATWHPIIMQFAGCHQPVQHLYWPENAIDWLV